jgi:hypothetical protein
MKNGIIKQSNSPILFLNFSLYEVFMDRMRNTTNYHCL